MLLLRSNSSQQDNEVLDLEESSEKAKWEPQLLFGERGTYFYPKVSLVILNSLSNNEMNFHENTKVEVLKTIIIIYRRLQYKLFQSS
jgi:hypothetical protein